MKIIDANHIHHKKIESDVCIIGAGPAGISLAGKLAVSGLNIIIAESGGIERDDKVNELNSQKITSNFTYRESQSLRNRQIGGTANIWAGRVVPFSFDDILDEEWGDLQVNVLPFYADAFRIFGIDEKIRNQHSQNKNELYAYWAHEMERFNMRSEMLKKNDEVCVYHYLTCVGEPVFEGDQIRRMTFKNRKGDKIPIESKYFVFAMGAIENSRMLLLFRKSLNKEGRDKLRNTGKFVMDHPRVWHGNVENRSERSVISRYQIKKLEEGFYKTGIRNKPKSSRVYCNLMRKGTGLNKLLDMIPSESFQVSFLKFLMREKGILKVTTNEMLKWPLIGQSKYFKNSFKHSFNNDSNEGFYTMTYCEQRPRETNEIILTKTKDEYEVPIPRLHNRIHEEELREVSEFYNHLKDFFKSMDCRFDYDPVHLSNPSNYVDASHIMGGTRYSAYPAKSVLRKDLSVIKIPNLYVTGSSVFPTSGVENPTHLIVSLSCYLADVLKRKLV